MKNDSGMQRYAAALVKAAAAISTDDGRPILRLTDSGAWVFGQDSTQLDERALLAVNPMTIQHGYIAFKRSTNEIAYTVDNEPAALLWPITEPVPMIGNLPELETDKRAQADQQPRWSFQISIDMKIIDGPDKGTDLVYKPTSRGGLQMCRKLMEEFARRISSSERDLLVPVLEMYSEKYFHKTWNKDIYTPAFAIVEWTGISGDTPPVAGAIGPSITVTPEQAAVPGTPERGPGRPSRPTTHAAVSEPTEADMQRQEAAYAAQRDRDTFGRRAGPGPRPEPEVEAAREDVRGRNADRGARRR